jgi:hypothetical protein
MNKLITIALIMAVGVGFGLFMYVQYSDLLKPKCVNLQKALDAEERGIDLKCDRLVSLSN